MSSLFVVFASGFQGGDAVLMLCDNAALHWLIDMLSGAADFVVKREVGQSSGLCTLFVKMGGEPTAESFERIGEKEFVLSASREWFERNIEQLRAMLATNAPCHQYLDVNSQSSLSLIVSRGEYSVEMFGGVESG